MANAKLIFTIDRIERSPTESFFDRLFGITLSNGWPDRMFVTDETLVGVEIKRDSHPLTSTQMAKAEDLHSKGFKYTVLRQFELTNRVHAPKFIFVIWKYIGRGCFQGMHIEEFIKDIGVRLADPFQVEKLDMSVFKKNPRYSGFLLSAQVGPIYTVKEG